MTISRRFETREPLPFNLYDYYEHDDPIPMISSLMRQGKLPFDSLFRLSAIGCRQVDPENPQHLLQWRVLHDMADNGGDPSKLNPVTQDILFGPQPDAVIDCWQSSNSKAYTLLDPMYYRLANLTRSVRELRLERGTYLDRLPSHMDSPESQRCRALSRSLWRVIVKKIHPEWLENPADYCPPTIYFGSVYYPTERTMQRRNVGRAVISDPTILGVYTEAVETGVKGIGPSGKESLRKLLIDEHPELE